MKRPKQQFQGAAKTVRMDAARYLDPEKRMVVVRPAGAFLQDGDVRYYARDHKGHLQCLHCDAGVHLRDIPSAAVAGSSLKSSVPYYALNRGQTHDQECEFYAEPKAPSTRRAIDKTKGYQININVQDFNHFTKEDGVYSRKGAIATINDDDLADRELLVIRHVNDLVDMLAEKDAMRIRDSVVVFNNDVLPWEKFFIRYNHKGNDQPRFTGLVERLKNEGPDAQVFCLMELQVAKPRYGSYGEKRKSVTSKRIPYQKNEDGTNRDIIPGAYIDFDGARANAFVAMEFSRGHHYLALGLVSLRQSDDGAYFLNMRIANEGQVAVVNIENIARERQQAQKNLSSNAAERSPSSP